MKKISIITTIVGALMLIVGFAPLLFSFLVVPNTPSVGIIGAADGPTAIFITSTLWLNSIYGRLAILGVVALIIGVVLLIISIFKKK